MNFQFLLLIGVIALVAKNIFGQAGDFVRNTAADTILGNDILGIRSVEGKKAADWIRNCLWLRQDYRTWLLSNYRVSDYKLDLLGANVAEDIAHNIIQANFVIFGEGMIDKLVELGLAEVGHPQDHPDMVVQAVSRINNQIQALEVQDYYYQITHKNLSAGLQWLPDTYMIDIYDHLKSLPTGMAKRLSNGKFQSLSSLPIPKIKN